MDAYLCSGPPEKITDLKESVVPEAKKQGDVEEENEELKAEVRRLQLVIENIKDELIIAKEKETKLEQMVEAVRDIVANGVHVVTMKRPTFE